MCEWCGHGPTCAICGRGLPRAGGEGWRVLSLLGDVMLFALGCAAAFGAYLAIRGTP